MDNTFVLLGVVVVSILISMTLHEAMHAFASFWLGDDTAQTDGRLTLNPFKHIDPFLTVLLPLSLIIFNISSITSHSLPIVGAAKPVPFNPNRVKYEEYGAALVGLAGPLTNLLLALVGAGILRLLIGPVGQAFVDVLYIFIQVNIGFFVFNMIPFPPLDGSRVLFAVAPEPVQKIMYQIEGLGLLGIFVFLFLFFPVLSPVLIQANSSLLRFLVGG